MNKSFLRGSTAQSHSTLLEYSTPSDAIQVPNKLKLLRRIGYVLFGLQFLGLLAFSAHIYEHFSLTWDFAIYDQAWWLIGHGQLLPYDTVLRTSFWGHHGELIVWPLALITSQLPTGPTMLFLQDLATVGAEIVAFAWVCRLLQKESSAKGMPATAIAGCVLIVLLVNPWTWWSIAQDFHLEAFMALFSILLARDLEEEKPTAWIWAILLLSCGDVASIIVFGVGISAVLASRKRHVLRRYGLILIAVALGWIILLSLLGADQSHTLSDGYGYLAGLGSNGTHYASMLQIAFGALIHPSRWLNVLWTHRLDVYATIAIFGIIPIASNWGSGVPTVVLLSNNLNMYQNGVFAAPGYQGQPIAGFLAVGLATVINAINRRRPWLAWILSVLIVVNALGWSIVWLPRTNDEWVNTTSPAVQVLNRAVTSIPVNDELIVSQGVAGRFANRPLIYPYRTGATFPIIGSQIYFVLTAYQGVETVGVSGTLGSIYEVAKMGANLVAHGGGIWIFRWTPPPGQTQIQLPLQSKVLPAWALETNIGQPVLNGTYKTWHMEVPSSRSAGYGVFGAYFRLFPGQYDVSVSTVTSAPVNVEIWDDNRKVLLERVNFLGMKGSPIVVPFTLSSVVGSKTFPGILPFAILPLKPPPGELIEVRVWIPASTTASISSVSIQAA